MVIVKKSVAKKVDNLLKPVPKGKKKYEQVKRTGEYSVQLASVDELESGERIKVKTFSSSALQNALQMVGGKEDDVAKWFDYGRLQYARIATLNNLLSVGVEKLDRKERRAFNSSIRDFVDKVSTLIEFGVAEDQAGAITLLKAKEGYASIIAHFESLKDITVAYSIDDLGSPAWFGGEEEEDEEEEETEE